MKKHRLIKSLILSLFLIVICTIASSAAEPAYRNSFEFAGADNANIYIKVSSWIQNKTKVARHIAVHEIDGNNYYIVKKNNGSLCSNPSYSGVKLFASIWDFTNSNDTSVHSYTGYIPRSEFNDYFAVQTQDTYTPNVNPINNGKGGVAFSYDGHEYLTHSAYMFAAWMWYDNIYEDINEFNGGNAYLQNLYDYNTPMVKIGNGSWTVYTGAIPKQPAGTTVYFKLVSGLGYESAVAQYTFLTTIDDIIKEEEAPFHVYVNGGTYTFSGQTYNYDNTFIYNVTNLSGIRIGKLISTPKNVTKDYWTFKNWVMSGGKTGSLGQNASFLLTAETSATAEYKPNAVQFYANGGSSAAYDIGSNGLISTYTWPQSNYATGAQTYQVYANPFSSGPTGISNFGVYKKWNSFNGWKSSTTGNVIYDTGSVFNYQQILNKSGTATFYAQWEPIEYSLGFIANGGTYTYKNTEYINENSSFNPVYGGDTIILPKATRANWNFVGWDAYDNGTYVGTLPEGRTYMINGDTKFYAVFEPIEVNYNANGGTVSGNFTLDHSNNILENGKKYEASLSYTLLDATAGTSTYNEPQSIFDASKFGLARPGYRFVGWTKVVNGTYGCDGIYNDNNNYTSVELFEGSTAASITYYAVWSPINIEYDVNQDSINGLNFPTNIFSTTTSDNVKSFVRDTSLVTLNGKSNTITSVMFGYFDNMGSINGKTYTAVLVYDCGSDNASGTTKFTINAINKNGNNTGYSESVNLPDADYPIKTVDIEIPNDNGSTGLSFSTENTNGINFANYGVHIYITENSSVLDTTLLTNAHTSASTSPSAADYIKTSANGAEYINLPASQQYGDVISNCYSLPTSVIHPFGHHVDRWTTGANSASDEVTTTTKITDINAASNHIVYAQWAANSNSIKYNTGSSLVTVKNADFTVWALDNTTISTSANNKAAYSETYIYNSNVDIHPSAYFDLYRTGYDFANWKFDLTNTLYTNETTTVEDLFADKADVNNTVGTFVAQWTPHTYTIDFVCNMLASDYVNGRAGTNCDTYVWPSAYEGDEFNFLNGTLYKADSVQNFTYDEALKSVAYPFDQSCIDGWYAYSANGRENQTGEGMWCTGYENGQYIWNTVSEINDNNLTLYVFSTDASVSNLTPVDNNTITMVAKWKSVTLNYSTGTTEKVTVNNSSIYSIPVTGTANYNYENGVQTVNIYSSLIKRANGSDFTKAYDYSDNVNVISSIYDGSINPAGDTGFGLSRTGYTFEGWKFSTHTFNGANVDYNDNDTTTVFDMYGTSSNGTGLLTAQWSPNNYTVEMWCDLGCNDFTNGFINSKGDTTKYTWGQNIAGSTLTPAGWGIANAAYPFTFTGNQFYRSNSPLTVEYGQYATATPFTNTGKHISGWNAYSTADKTWCTGVDSDGNYIWNTEADIVANGLSLYEIPKTFKDLTSINGNTIVLIAIWDTNFYYVSYDGDGATNNTYDTTYDGLIEATSLDAINEYPCEDSFTYYPYKTNRNDTGWFYEYNVAGGYILHRGQRINVDYNSIVTGVVSNTTALQTNRFSRTGYNANVKTQWIASMYSSETNNIEKYYGYNYENVLGWYNLTDVATFYLFADGEELNNNITIDHLAQVTMHACWIPNEYNVFYCGGIADGQTYGTNDVSVDELGSMFSLTTQAATFDKYRYINANDGSNPRYTIDVADATTITVDCCPLDAKDNILANGELGDFYDQRTWTYDKSQTLYEQKFSKTGYTFDGWFVYNAKTNLWYGENDANTLGWYPKDQVARLAVYTNTETSCINPEKYVYIKSDDNSFVNITSDENGVVYCVAKWIPIPFHITYEGNNATAGSMTDGAYLATFGSAKLSNDTTTCYYDNKYILHKNSYEYIVDENDTNRLFRGWYLRNGDNEWYGYTTDENACDWYSIDAFDNGSVKYKTFRNTVINGDDVSTTTLLKSVTSKYDDVITAVAQWTDTTILHYNINADDVTVSNSKYYINNGYVCVTSPSSDSVELTVPSGTNWTSPLVSTILDITSTNTLPVYSQLLLTDNTDTRVGYGYQTAVTLKTLADFGIVRKGYTIDKWSAGSAQSTSYINPADINTTLDDIRTAFGDKNLGVFDGTLYAQWRYVNYNVYYCGNGADGQLYGGENTSLDSYGSYVSKSFMDGSECANAVNGICQSYNYYNQETWTYNSDKELAKNKFTKDGYSFVGWTTTPEMTSSSIIYKDEQAVRNLADSEGAVVYLYAQWVKTAISYNANGGVIANGSSYVLNSDDFVCTYPSLMVYKQTLESGEPVKSISDFNMSNTNNAFIGWTKDPVAEVTSDMIAPGASAAAIKQYFALVPADECVLYAVWSDDNNIICTYNTNTDDQLIFASSIYNQNEDHDVTKSGVLYKDVYTNSDASISVKSKSYFGLYNNNNAFVGWHAEETIAGVIYYFSVDGWLEKTSDNIAAHEYYMFAESENVNITTTPLAGYTTSFMFKDIDSRGYNIKMYAQWTETDANKLIIQYAYCEPGIIDASRSYNFTETNKPDSQINITLPQNNVVPVDNLVRFVTDGVGTPFTQEIFASNVSTTRISKVGVSGLNIVNLGYSCSGWEYNGVTYDPDCLASEIIQKNPSIEQDLASGDVTVTLTAKWAPNHLTVYYNAVGANADGITYNIDSDGYITKLISGEGINKRITTLLTYDALFAERDVLLDGSSILSLDRNVFNGWTIRDKDIEIAIGGSYRPSDLSDAIKYGDADVVLYANWDPYKLHIEYNANTGIVLGDGFGVNTEDALCKDGNLYKQMVLYDNPVTLDTAEYFGLIKPSCQFAGWNTEPDGSGITFEVDSEYHIKDMFALENLANDDNNIVTLYAQWESSSYNVYYCGNGADGESYSNYISTLTTASADYGSIFSTQPHNEISCDIGDCYSVGNFYHNKSWSYGVEDKLFTNLYTKTGYSFSGYWTDNSGNEYYADENLVDIAGSNSVIFLYAQWTPNYYTIEYDGNGETGGSLSDQEIAYDDIALISQNIFDKEYYHNNTNVSWYATRTVGDTTVYCTSYNYNETTGSVNIIWTPENELVSMSDVYMFAENMTIKNLTSVDGDIVTMHAQWIPNTLSIHYNAASGKTADTTNYSLSDTQDIIENSTNNKFTQIYTYENDSDTINLYSDSTFSLYKVEADDNYVDNCIFVGWAFDSIAADAEFEKKMLNNVLVSDITSDLANGNVELTLYAVWGEHGVESISYYEGETVSKEKLLFDMSNASPYFNLAIDTNLDLIYPTTQSGYTYDGDYADLDANGLNTYFEHLQENETVSMDMYYTSTDAYGFANKPGDKTVISIIYNHPPVITAYDRWYTLDEARMGKITQTDLLKAVIATDIESGNLTQSVKIVDFGSLNFNAVGDYEVTYTVEDNIPVIGQHKSTTTTATVHITDNYNSETTRFISENYYPMLNDNLFIDENGNFKAKKINGILYFLDKNNEICIAPNGDGYIVEAGLKVKKLLNADGTYKIIPMSKWYVNNDCILSLKDCLSNVKNDNGTWQTLEESWTFNAETIKAIKENIIANKYDADFYSNYYANGHCISYSNRAEIASVIDPGESQAQFLLFNGSVLTGFKDIASEGEWSSSFANRLIIPTTYNDNIITDIATDAFRDNISIEYVVVPSSVTHIATGAFNGCTSLKIIIIKGNEGSCVLDAGSIPDEVSLIYLT